MDARSLQTLLAALEATGYGFIAPTPATSRRWVERATPGPRLLRDIFGWSLAFAAQDLDPDLLALGRDGGWLVPQAAGWRATVRVSTVHGRLFLHSAFPTDSSDAVFLGPDTYRFADLIAAEIGRAPVNRLLDLGAGAGVGGILAARYAPGARVFLSDINPLALELAGANAAHAGVKVERLQASGLEAAPPGLDLILANPPYIAGDSGHIYKDGGDLHGARLSLDWATEGLSRLTSGGRLLLYTGSAILQGGFDAFRVALEAAVAQQGGVLAYRELDPDVFGGELRRPAYADVERIAAVAAVIAKPA